MEAKARGAKVIHVDPRFTRTSARRRPARAAAGRHRHRVPRRPDQLRPAQREVLPRLRARLHQRGDDPDRGLRRHRGPGRGVLRLRPEHRTYDFDTWQYEGAEVQAASGERDEPRTRTRPRPAGAAGGPRRGARLGRRGAPPGRRDTDPTLQHPRCVFQVLKRHFARYTPEMVERGLRRARRSQFARVLRAASPRTPAGSGPPRSSTASAGPSTRSACSTSAPPSILQPLLGNIGRPGGGILALRGHASIQGSTDIPTLFNLLPGYLPMPHAHTQRGPGRLRRGREHRARASGPTRATTWSAC